MTVTTDPVASTEPATSPPGGRPLADRPVVRSTSWLPWTVVAVAALLVLPDFSIPVLRPVAGLLLVLVVPVWVLSRRLGLPLSSPVHAVALSAGLTLFAIIVGGLLMNTLLPLAGVSRPLDRLPIAIAVVLADAGLLAWRHSVPLLRTDPALVGARLVALRWRPVPALAVANVAVAVVGAVRLNNGAGSTVAVAGHVGVAVLLGLVLFARGDDLRRDAIATYAVGLSLLLATSLRSWYVSGHDVQREYISFQVTDSHGRWSMADYQTAYHACLSVNILPTVLAETTGLSGAVVFKLVLQLIAGLLPVIVLLLARQVVDRRLALAAVAVFVGFPTFATDMPYLTRQEVAFIFLGLAFLVAGQTGLGLRQRRFLASAFGVGVVLSHYSTTYLMITTLAVGLAALHAEQRWQRHRRDKRATAGNPDAPPPPREPLVVLHPSVLVALLVATFLWVSPITHSGGHLVDTMTSSLSSLVGGKSDGPSSSDLSYGILPGAKTTDDQRMELFAEDVIDARTANEESGTTGYLLPITEAMKHPTTVAADPDPLTRAGAAVNRVIPVSTVNSLLRLGFAFLLQVLLLIGLVAIVLRRARGHLGLSDQNRALMVGSLAGVGMVVVVPGLSAEYGVLRAFQQGFVLLAPVVVIGAMTLIGRVTRHAATVVAAGAVALLVVLTGVLSTVTGGYVGVLALSNTGPYHRLHYVTDAEVAGYRWLGLNAGGRIVQAEVLSDKLAANRLQYYPQGGVLVASDMFPAGIVDQSVVFLGPDTVHDGTAEEFYTGTALTYEFPTRQLSRHLDVVFSSPDARILW